MGKSKKKKISLKCFYGIPHCHTAFSTGRGNPNDAYEYSKNNGLDFIIITDHNSYLSKDISWNNKQVSKWTILKAMCERFSKKTDSFLPMIGFETKTSYYGDFNIINSSTYFTGVVNDLKLLLIWMLNNPEAIVTINHPHRNILSLENNDVLNKIITSIEVGNGSYPHKYVRHDKYYYALLDKGWKLGAINGQDNHRINFGDGDNLTGVLSYSLSKEDIIEAFRERRTFSTESRTLNMYFTINDCIMGSVIYTTDNILRFMIFAEDIKIKIKSIEIVSNKGAIIKKIDNINLNSIKYLYDHKCEEKESWYLIRIWQHDNRLAISSPIFISDKEEVVSK